MNKAVEPVTVEPVIVVYKAVDPVITEPDIVVNLAKEPVRVPPSKSILPVPVKLKLPFKVNTFVSKVKFDEPLKEPASLNCIA